MARLARVRLWQDPDGRWCAEWMKPGGKRVWTYHASEAEALAAKVEV